MPEAPNAVNADRQLWVGTSWKMNNTLAEAKEYVQALNQYRCHSRIQGFVIPPFTLVREVRALLNERYAVGAQNMHWEDEGAWTGEISGTMLRDCNLDMVELGHYERRTHFAETDHSIGLKVAAALRHKLVPIICVGETREQRDADSAHEVLASQVQQALQFIPQADLGKSVLFAYEPFWAIGSDGEAASAEYAAQQHRLITDTAKTRLGVKVPCLYGGSVNRDNCQELISAPAIDGLFIGRAALDASGYIEILELVAQQA